MMADTDFDKALARFTKVSASPISDQEFQQRIARLQAHMKAQGIGAVWLDASSSLHYFCAIKLGQSERIHGALILPDGAPIYVSPTFEEPKLQSLLRIPGQIALWQEDENPYQLIAKLAGDRGPLALDAQTPWLFAAPLMAEMNGRICEAKPVIAALRQLKSDAELAIIRTAMQASWQVQKAVWQGLREGISTTETCAFIDAAHRAMGLRPLFSAVQFGEATAYPHGVPYAQKLVQGDMVLVDLGATLHGYQSDITRCYVFGEATARQRAIWDAERDARDAAFAAAQLGASCESVDAAARASLEAKGYGPGYAVPGLPHRTGHGLGMDIHEEPFIVKGNRTLLAPGMCFSIEPMLCLYGECGVRLEDIAFMTQTGAEWFVPPSASLDQPFAVTSATENDAAVSVDSH